MAENFIKITYKRKEIYKTILLLFQHPPEQPKIKDKRQKTKDKSNK